MIGRMIGERYEIQQVLGGGGMSKVYGAMDTILDRKVAIKLIQIPPSEKQATIDRFEREVQNTTQLSHENIVSVWDVGEEDDCFYLVMEYIEGMTLSEYIKTHGALEPKTAVAYINQVLQGIQHAHEQGIVHRDIKPQNMMIDPNDTIKIVDFGIAKALSETTMTQTNHVIGTVQYLSPEQAKGEKTGEQSDIYSIGIVLYEMLTGSAPFTGETAVSIAIKQIQENVPNVTEQHADIPQALSNVILRATEKEPANRYKTASEMLHDVATVLDPSRANEPVYETEDDALTKTVALDKNALKQQQEPASNDTANIPIVPTAQTNASANARPRTQRAAVTGAYAAKPKRSRKKKVIAGLVLVLLFVGLFFFVTAAVMGNKYSQVPDVLGQTEEQATQTLKDENLKVGKVVKVYSNRFEEGHVAGINPGQGTKVKQKTAVDLMVSKGEHVEKMPDLVGRPKVEAEEILAKLGFEKVEYTTAYTQNDIAKGNVEAQSVAPGTEVSVTKEKILITESLGKRKVFVDDYTNKDIEEARAKLEAEGLTVTVTKEREDDKVKENHIISQTPKNKEVDEGSEVKFVVSLGSGDEEDDADSKDKSKDKEPPKFDKRYSQSFVIPYTGQNNKPQKVEVYVKDKNNDGQKPHTFEIKKDTPQTLNFTIASDSSASYRVLVDGKEINSGQIDYDDF
ncbi:serine/threonine protein kinase [Staphylococcus microti]|uniref:Serine/threonine-protein kinase PrkC n=1 Tax=Staphylococcus microti TaxID=569857 RepID=A0A0D6XPR9_9STAP|nr:Stk1 family PASTA domain-containing Ser/Thr kinase [Staphylococcus microti]KIX90395.1 serine/threonine protein kinase [Staphylococcus microti]PNZ82965.1 serine/threonine-protein kinase [Staphylococcus microti]SUM57249.1 serine/threonine-protein kinase PrkC [Staphylococcus microti]